MLTGPREREEEEEDDPNSIWNHEHRCRWRPGFVRPACIAAKAKKPDAKSGKLAAARWRAGVGYSWGSGTLTYKGVKYPITVDGLSAGSVGATDITASGKVYHLKKLEDFEGNYAAVGAGATVGGGR